MKKPIRVSIIGCGDIAGGYDERKKTEGVFSHSQAYRSLPDIEIVSAFDINPRRLEDFCKYWKIDKRCGSLEELLSGSYDIVSVCTPDETHQAILEELLALGHTSYIWAEKPLTSTVKGAEEVIRRARKRNIGLWLSNQRRWDPAHLAVKEKIKNGEIGELVHVTGYYVKGIAHVGCTAIDTMRFLCGEVKWVAAFPPYNAGSYGNDFSLRGIMGLDNEATACIVGCDRKEYTYSLFEIDILGTKGRIRIEENGSRILFYKVKEYGDYPGFKDLKPAGEIKTEIKWSMKYGLDSLLKDFLENKRSVYFAEEGLKDLRIVEALKQSAEKEGQRIEI